MSELSLLLRDAQDVITTPTTALVQMARSNNRNNPRWDECHSSSKSFFENKNGFPSHSPDYSSSSHLILPNLQAASKDPMFRRIFKSMAQTHFLQQRGFKTRRAQKPSFGTREKDNSLMGNFQDFLGKLDNKASSSSSTLQSQPLGKIGIDSASVKS